MISKIGTSLSSLLLISSINAVEYNQNGLESQSVGFANNDLGCASCIQAGYTYAYNQQSSADLNLEQIAANGAYSGAGFCCGPTSCGNSIPGDLSSQASKMLSSMFASPTLAMANCPSKVDICGSSSSLDTTSSNTLVFADKDASAVDVSINAGATKMGSGDQCVYHMKVTCDLPVVTVKAATNDFLDDSKIGVVFIEKATSNGFGEKGYEKTDKTTWNSHAHQGPPGTLYPFAHHSVPMLGDTEAGLIYAKMLGRPYDVYTQRGGALEQQLRDYKTAVDAAGTELAGFTVKMKAYLDDLTARGKYFIGRNFPQETPVEPKELTMMDVPKMPPMAPMWKGINPVRVQYDYGGYGTPTSGYINVVEGEKKSFGVMGQGASDVNDQGFSLYRANEVLMDECYAKYMSVVVYPKQTSGYTSTGGLTLTFGAEADSEHSFEVEASSPILPRKGIVQIFREYNQEQMQVEYLGAAQMAISAATASLAAFYLF